MEIIIECAELLLDQNNGNYRAAFCDALAEVEEGDKRTKQYKHYSKVLDWMIYAWKDELS